MILLKTFASRAEADLCKSILESAEIWAFVAADDVAGLRPSLALTNGARLMVQPEDFELAKKTLQMAEVTSGD